MSALTAFTTRNKLALEVTISNGTPQGLTLELIRGNAVPQVFTLDDSIEALGGGVYRYVFTPADDASGPYSYRWYGVDSQGASFSVPSVGTDRYRRFTVY